jgi:two-component system, LuxR family, response regulator FixJ
MAKDSVVFVVDDDEAVRNSLRWLVESVNMKVKCFAGAQEFLEAYDPGTPGCLVLDVRMRGMSGLQLQEELEKRNIQIPIIIITGHGDIPMAVTAMKGGAVDFIEKPLNYQALLDRIQDAIGRDDQRRSQTTEARVIQQRLDALSPRERQVLERVVAGRLNKQIAADLDISPKTVEMHRAHLMQKMEAGSVAELVRMVMTVSPELAQQAQQEQQ